MLIGLVQDYLSFNVTVKVQEVIEHCLRIPDSYDAKPLQNPPVTFCLIIVLKNTKQNVPGGAFFSALK